MNHVMNTYFVPERTGFAQYSTVLEQELQILGTDPGFEFRRKIFHQVELDLTVIDHLDEQLRVLEQDLAMKAKAHDAGAYHLLRTVPGIGRI